MDPYLYLVFHILSHALFGAAITYLCLPSNTWKERIISLGSGALCGIAPDIFGNRTISPWSHSILFAPLLVVGIACLTKLFYKNVSFKLIWGSSTLSVLFGHLLLDYMDHDLPAFYPISDKSFALEVITLGDPWIWFPFVVGLGLSLFLKNRPKRPILISILFFTAYFIVRVVSKEVIEQQVQAQYPVSEKSYINVKSNQVYEYRLNPMTWLEYKFEIYGAHHSRGGYAGLWGEKSDELIWHDFFPVARDIREVNGGYELQYGAQPVIFIRVTREWTESGYHFIQGKYDGELLTFKEVTHGQWVEQ